MARTCECGYPVWGTDKNTGIGYCARHQYLRTDAKKPKKPQYHAIKCKGESLTTRMMKQMDFGFEDQISMFQWCWENAQNEKGEVFCKYTGEKLNMFFNTDMFWSCFAHVLSKGKYPWFKLNPENIAVVNPGFHTLVDQGTSLQRTNHPTWRFDLWYNEVEKMKAEYASFKKKNLLA